MQVRGTADQVMNITIPSDDLLTPPQDLGFSDNRCYIGIIPYNKRLLDSNVWYLGTQAIKSYYVVLDQSQTHLQEAGRDHI